MRRALSGIVVALGAGGCGIDEPLASSGAGAELVALAAGPSYALVGEPVRLDGSLSRGAVAYQWDFGDGSGWSEPRAEPEAMVLYEAPGRYRAVLTVFDAAGRERTDAISVAVTHPADFAPSESRTLAVVPTLRRVAVVSGDSNELVVWQWDEADRFELVTRVSTPAGPRSVTVWGDAFAVPCAGEPSLLVAPIEDPGSSRRLELPGGSRPYGAAARGDALFVTLQGTGEIARVERDASGGARLVERISVVADARAIAALPDARLAVARFRSPDARGELVIVDPDLRTAEIWPLAFDPQLADDVQSGGVPSYLGEVAVCPTGRTLAVPSLQANAAEGVHLSGRPLSFETTLRAAVSFLELPGGDELPRELFDNRGLASAVAWSSHGDWLFVAMRGNHAVERFDFLSRAQSGSILDAGEVPSGLALSGDDRLLFVNAELSRELRVFDVTDFSSLPEPLARLPIVETEPLPAAVLRGKRLFNDASDPRISRDGYVACAHCHLDGEHDGRTWDFTDRGEGLRNTIALLGRAAGDGPLHWSGNFDEIQDFEHDIRGPFRGTGLMSDSVFHAGTRDTTLGDPKAGASDDLDALAAYVASLDRELASPYRASGGGLPPAAQRGKLLFESPQLACTSCHAGARLTDSRFVVPGEPLLHDVGTLGPGSGGRLGGALDGIDTPSLHGLWHSAPYLHDGSAPTLRAVLRERNPDDRHGVTRQLDDAQLDDLVAYLLCLDGRGD